MILFASSSSPVQSTINSRPSLPIEALRQQVESLNPELQSESSTFQAAVLLLAASEIGQNVERLARYTGLQRDFVAKCARRLCDNGAWRDGQVVYTWAEAGEDTTALWKDVQVAEGKLCRRTNGEGVIEWAPAGYWTKSYEYVERQSASELSTLYLSRVPQEPCADEFVASVGDSQELNADAPEIPQPAPRCTASSAGRKPACELRRTSSIPAGDIQSEAPEQELPRCADLFPGAVWLM